MRPKTYLEKNNLYPHDYAMDAPSCYSRQKCYTYYIESSINKGSNNIKKNYQENISRNSNLESNNIPKYQSSSYYQNDNKYSFNRYFKNDNNDKNNDIINNNSIKKSQNLYNNENNYKINDKTNKDLNQISNINKTNTMITDKNKIDNQNSNKKYIPKSKSYHYKTSTNTNINNNRFHYSYQPKKFDNYSSNNINNNLLKNKIPTKIINTSPTDQYYNTYHDDYIPKIKESNNNNICYRTYEIDSSKYDDNHNSLYCNSNIYNDLLRKNRMNYC